MAAALNRPLGVRFAARRGHVCTVPSGRNRSGGFPERGKAGSDLCLALVNLLACQCEGLVGWGSAGRHSPTIFLGGVPDPQRLVMALGGFLWRLLCAR